jgi:hypothetical protein
MTPKTQEFKMSGDTLVKKLKELLHEGDIRRITIQNEEGHTLIEIPLTFGLVGVLFLPVWAAIGALAALAANFTILVERKNAPLLMKPEVASGDMPNDQTDDQASSQTKNQASDVK